MEKRDTNIMMRFISFVAVFLIGLSLLLTKIFTKGNIIDVLNTVAFLLAVFVVAVSGFFYAYGKLGRGKTKNVWYMIAWALAVALIVVTYVI